MPRPSTLKAIVVDYIQAAHRDVWLAREYARLEQKRREDEARRLALQPKPITLTIGPVSTNSNGTFQIASIASTTIQIPPFYGGTLDPETGRLYDARRPSGERSVDPREVERRRARSKAARKARKKGRHGK